MDTWHWCVVTLEANWTVKPDTGEFFWSTSISQWLHGHWFKALVLNWCAIWETTMTPCLFHLCYVNWMLYKQSDRFQANCAGQRLQRAGCNAVYKPATQTNTLRTSWDGNLDVVRNCKIFLFFRLLKCVQCNILGWTFNIFSHWS